jgi:hypothetical protein
VPDALHDERFTDRPLVTRPPRLRFYAGHPLCTADGDRVGTLFIADYRPRVLNGNEARMLADLAALAQIEIGRARETEAFVPGPAVERETEAVRFDLLPAFEEVLQELAPLARRRGIELSLRYPPYVPRHVVGDPVSIRRPIAELLDSSITSSWNLPVLLEVQCLHRSERDAELLLEIWEAGGRAAGDPRRGHTLRVRLDPNPAPTRHRPELLGMRALIADGHDERRRALRETLAGWGMRCVGARSVTETLSALGKGQAEEDPFAVLILHEGLAEPDGTTLTLATSTILLAAPAPAGRTASQDDAGSAARLSTPVRQATLMRELAAICGRELERRAQAAPRLLERLARLEKGAAAGSRRKRARPRRGQPVASH